MLLNPAMSVALLLAQILAWRYWSGRLRKGPGRLALGCLYLAVNAMAVSVLVNWYWTMEPPPANPVAWSLFYRPILLWEMVHLAWLILYAVCAALVLPFKWAARRRSKGLPSLFRAKSEAPPLSNLRLTLFLILTALAVLGYLRRLTPPELILAEVAVSRLPSDLEGLRVALLCDLHYGRGANWAQVSSIFESLRPLKPDLVIIETVITSAEDPRKAAMEYERSWRADEYY
jgi:hypothetical protein